MHMRQYKDSGIPWMKQIPDNWSVVRGKDFLYLKNRPVREHDDVVTCFRDGEVVLRSERRTEGFTMSDKEIGYQGINKGDIVIHGMDGFAGAMGVSKSTGKGSPVLIVCNPKSEDDASYIIYYLRSLAMNNVFVALATGIRERSCDLRWNKISVLPFVRPSFPEQIKIADFIDKKSEDIDSLIELQELMIEKLKAYKQSIITESVTKGLDPNARLVPSGIDWIGLIPERWKVCRFKSYIHLHNEKASETVEFKINLENIESKSGRYIPTNSKYEGEGTTFKKGDVLFGKLRPYLAKVYAPENEGSAIGDIYVFRPSSQIDTTFLKYTLLADTFVTIVDSSTYGTKMPRANWEFISCVPIVVPSLSEQQAIASYLDEKCADIDRLIALKQQKIEKLKDYKKSVIYEAVTGKTDII